MRDAPATFARTCVHNRAPVYQGIRTSAYSPPHVLFLVLGKCCAAAHIPSVAEAVWESAAWAERHACPCLFGPAKDSPQSHQRRAYIAPQGSRARGPRARRSVGYRPGSAVAAGGTRVGPAALSARTALTAGALRRGKPLVAAKRHDPI